MQSPFKPWTFVSIFSLIICLLAICLNAFVLLLLARNAGLRTPFTIYIINLLVANLVNQIYQQPLTIATLLYSPTYLGRAFCNANLYGSYAIHSAIYSAHFAITLNRIWAVTSPENYRLYHRKKFSVISCVVLMVYVHVIVLPGLLMNYLYYEMPLEAGCYIAKQRLRTWSIVEQLMLYDIPLSFLILAYPVICFAQIRRRTRRNRLIQFSYGSRSNHNGVELAHMGMPSRVAVGKIRVSGSATHTSNAFVLLTALTLSNCVFLLPLTVAYNLTTGFYPRGELPRKLVQWKTPQLYVVTPMLFYAQAMVDPILFTLALPDLRSAALTALNDTYQFLKSKF